MQCGREKKMNLVVEPVGGATSRAPCLRCFVAQTAHRIGRLSPAKDSYECTSCSESMSFGAGFFVHRPGYSKTTCNVVLPASLECAGCKLAPIPAMAFWRSHAAVEVKSSPQCLFDRAGERIPPPSSAPFCSGCFVANSFAPCLIWLPAPARLGRLSNQNMRRFEEGGQKPIETVYDLAYNIRNVVLEIYGPGYANDSRTMAAIYAAAAIAIPVRPFSFHYPFEYARLWTCSRPPFFDIKPGVRNIDLPPETVRWKPHLLLFLPWTFPDDRKQPPLLHWDSTPCPVRPSDTQIWKNLLFDLQTIWARIAKAAEVELPRLRVAIIPLIPPDEVVGRHYLPWSRIPIPLQRKPLSRIRSRYARIHAELAHLLKPQSGLRTQRAPPPRQKENSCTQEQRVEQKRGGDKFRASPIPKPAARSEHEHEMVAEAREAYEVETSICSVRLLSRLSSSSVWRACEKWDVFPFALLALDRHAVVQLRVDMRDNPSPSLCCAKFQSLGLRKVLLDIQAERIFRSS